MTYVSIHQIYSSQDLSRSDYIAINHLLAQLNPDEVRSTSDQRVGALLAGGVLLLIARRIGNNSIVGMLILAPVTKLSQWHVEIHDVVVDQGHRRLGIARALIRQAIKVAMSNQHFDHISLTSKPDRIGANRLYQTLGFQLVAQATSGTPIQGTNLYRYYLRK